MGDALPESVYTARLTALGRYWQTGGPQTSVDDLIWSLLTTTVQRCVPDAPPKPEPQPKPKPERKPPPPPKARLPRKETTRPPGPTRTPGSYQGMSWALSATLDRSEADDPWSADHAPDRWCDPDMRRRRRW